MIAGGAALCSGQDCSPSWGPHSEQSKDGTSLLIVGVPTVVAVKTIASQVRDLDNDYYDRVFVLEPAIAACLSATP